jgi:hypothetical protein
MLLSDMIEIEIEAHEPPEGWVRDAGSSGPESQRQIRFSGWVGLVQAVSDLVNRDDSGEMPGGLRGEPGA